jgi:t-SNARE complex subunit (syntaxin)
MARLSLVTLAKLVESLDELHDHLLVFSSSADDSAEALRDLDACVGEFTRISSQVYARLKSMETEMQKFPEKSPERRVRTGQHAALAHRFVGVLETYREKQGGFEDRRRKMKQRHYHIGLFVFCFFF